MIGMQYKITLPSDFDMGQIETRVKDNGYKTDGFDGLLFKCYLVKEKGFNSMENMYAPLYVWKDNKGMNKFMFGGYFDHIIQSFGWQQVNIGIPIFIELSKDFKASKYVVEETRDITPQAFLNGLDQSLYQLETEDSQYSSRVCIYNPDKWRYSLFYFYESCPNVKKDIYRILHISQ